MTLHELTSRMGEMLIGRWDGPMSLRCVMQPLVACFLAIRSSIRDAHAGRPPYLFLPMFIDRSQRRELLRLLWMDVGKVFIVACLLDVIYELVVYHWIYPVQAIIMGAALAILPYLLLRGPVARIAQAYVRKTSETDG